MNAAEIQRRREAAAAHAKDHRDEARRVVNIALDAVVDEMEDTPLVSAASLIDRLRDEAERWYEEDENNEIAIRPQDGAMVIGNRLLFRLVPRLAAWVRQIQAKAGKRGTIRVVEHDGRMFFEPTKGA